MQRRTGRAFHREFSTQHIMFFTRCRGEFGEIIIGIFKIHNTPFFVIPMRYITNLSIEITSYKTTRRLCCRLNLGHRANSANLA